MSNTAITMMMLPIAFSVSTTVLEEVHAESKIKNYVVGSLLSIAYTCSIGGISTLVKTPPNLSFFKNFFNSLSKKSVSLIWTMDYFCFCN